MKLGEVRTSYNSQTQYVTKTVLKVKCSITNAFVHYALSLMDLTIFFFIAKTESDINTVLLYSFPHIYFRMPNSMKYFSVCGQHRRRSWGKSEGDWDRDREKQHHFIKAAKCQVRGS